jgi:hypothetical protein
LFFPDVFFLLLSGIGEFGGMPKEIQANVEAKKNDKEIIPHTTGFGFSSSIDRVQF